jgi:hypothetical protein
MRLYQRYHLSQKDRRPLPPHLKGVSLERLERGLAMSLALLFLGLAVLLLALAVCKVLLLATLITLYQGLVGGFRKLAKALCLPSLSKKDSFLSRH